MTLDDHQEKTSAVHSRLGFLSRSKLLRYALAAVVILIVSAGVLLLAMSGANGHRPNIPLVAQSPQYTSIRVVLDDNYPPYIFRDSEGKLQGILVDQWALWEERTGVKVHLRGMDWAKAQAVME